MWRRDDETFNADLRRMWDVEKLTANEIARRLNVTKNVVVGKARRLGCATRLSPIKPAREGAEKPKPVRLRTARMPLPVIAAPEVEICSIVEPETAKPRLRPCCWPLGDPRAPDFRFCGDGAKDGRPYCDAHQRMAFARHERA